MIFAGWFGSSSIKTEIIDVMNNTTCSDLADFPKINNFLTGNYQHFPIHGAVGSNLLGTPFVCGGEKKPYPYEPDDKCYKFTKTNSLGGWHKFTSMKDRRFRAAGIVYKNKFHIFGGYNRVCTVIEFT